MRILVLGGTGWLGGAVARVALARGHEVTCLARGSSAVPAGVTWVHADRDADDALEPVIRDDWDAVIDVSRTPQHVRRAARDLAGRVGRAVFVSTASVYADQATPGAAEESATLPARDPGTITTAEDYGSAKVMCEQIYRAAFGSERTHVARLGLIGGPGDVSDRSGYWPWRFARAATSHAPVLVPEGGERLVSLIDVRDAAAWLLDRAAGTDDEPGTVDVTGVPHPLSQFLGLARAAAGHRGEVVGVEEGWLVQQGVQPWSGPRSLPLWLPDPAWAGMMTRSTARARALGLVPRPLADTVADVLAWELERPAAHPRAAGLDDAEEQALLRAWTSERG